MVEGARLESVYRGNSIEGSNPSLSANLESKTYKELLCWWNSTRRDAVSSWSGEPSLFPKIILSPGGHDDATLKRLANDLLLDRLRIIHAEDLDLHSYLNFVSQN